MGTHRRGRCRMADKALVFKHDHLLRNDRWNRQLPTTIGKKLVYMLSHLCRPFADADR